MSPTLMPLEKRDWWRAAWPKQLPKQPRLAVFHHAITSTPRPSAPDESVGYGYMTSKDLGDGDAEAVVHAIDAVDDEFFASYPRDGATEVDATFKLAVVAEAACAFYDYGLSTTKPLGTL